MNLQETLLLIEALKASGVTKFKSLEHDIIFDGSVSIPIVKSKDPIELVVENKEAAEKIKDLINTMKMSPEELANQIFPDGAM